LGFQIFKVQHKNEIKRFEIPKTYVDLRLIIQKCFKQFKDSDFLITYKDEEDDNVVISNEFDLEQVMIFMDKQKLNLLRVFLDHINPEEKGIGNMRLTGINISQSFHINEKKEESVPEKKPEEKVEPKIEEKKQENVSPKQENSSKIENNFEIIPNKRDEEKNKFINIIDKHEEKKEDAPINEKKEDIPIKIDEILAKINQIQDKKIEEQKKQ